jgi:hypothetical protein
MITGAELLYQVRGLDVLGCHYQIVTLSREQAAMSDTTETHPTRARGASPSKAVRSPEEAMRLARKTPGLKILASQDHQKYGARVKANEIRTGRRGPWRQYHGEVCASALKQGDGTYNVYVYVNPDGTPDSDQ